MVHHNDYFYLFTNSRPDINSTTFSQLNIYYSKDIISDELIKHKGSTLIDARFARQGGEFIIKDDELYRVSQNNSKFYGLNITLHKVNKLTPYEYEEEITTSIGPDLFNKKYKGLHTLNQSDDIRVYDILYSGRK